MKVMCISEAPELAQYDSLPFKVKFGEIYTVVDDEFQDGELHYELSHDLGTVYLARLFAPISRIDETELIKERELVEAL